MIEASDIVEREHGPDGQGKHHGNIDHECFILWVKQWLIPLMGNYYQGEPRSIVVLDNASIHHGLELVELFKDATIKYIYTAP